MLMSNYVESEIMLNNIISYYNNIKGRAALPVIFGGVTGYFGIQNIKTRCQIKSTLILHDPSNLSPSCAIHFRSPFFSNMKSNFFNSKSKTFVTQTRSPAFS